MALRRDVYLPAIEATSRSQNALMRLIDLSISNEELSGEFGGDSGALAKIQLVGSDSTVQAVSAYSEAMAKAYIELLMKRAPLVNRLSRIEMLGEFINHSQSEQRRNIDLMKRLTLEGKIDQRTLSLLNENIDFERQQQTKYAQERDELLAKQRVEYREFAELCFDRFLMISRFIPPAIFALREELELYIDEKAFMEMFEENLERAREVITSFLRELAD